MSDTNTNDNDLISDLPGSFTGDNPGPATFPRTPPGSTVPNISDIHSTPLKVAVASQCATPHLKAYRMEIAEEIAKYFSSTSIDSWLNLWLPGKDLDLDNLPEEFSNKKFHFQDLILESKEEDSIKNEGQLYPKLCEVIQNIFDLAHHEKRTRPRLVIEDTSGWKEHSSIDNLPDGSVYLESDQEAYRLTMDELKTAQGSAERKPFLARTAFSKSLMPLEIKFDPSAEAFKVNKKGEIILPDSATSIQTRGQLFEYCMTIFGRQPRQHLFALHICRNMATLVVMDRVSVSATIPFDYVKEPLKLLTFFYRLALSDSSALGLDPTMTLASDADKAVLADFLPVVDRSKELEGDDVLIHEAFSDSRTNGALSIWPVYKVTVTSKEEDNTISTSNFLISKPRTSIPSLYGRGNKGYIAFDLEKHDFVFLKDSWRADSPDIHSEVEVYKKMQEAGLTQDDCVATMRCGGDVPIDGGSAMQRTRSQKLLKKRALGRIHCRLVLNEIAHHMSNYDNSRQMVFIIQCAFYGHKQVWTKVGILHGDVSDNNIMVVYRGDSIGGILIDWDLCKHRDDLEEKKVRNGNRSGTWPFISALRLQYPKKSLELSDDIESFIHVITWHALCYHKHSLSSVPQELALRVHSWFLNVQRDVDGLYYGCLAKFENIVGGHPGFELLDDSIFNQLIQDLYRLAQEHYKATDLDDFKKFRPALPELDETAKVRVKKVSRSDVQKIPSSDDEDDYESNTTYVPPADQPKPVSTLEDHKRLGRIFSRYVSQLGEWKGTAKVNNQFRRLPNVNFTNEQGVVIGTNVSKTKASSGS
ncbi:hypothetical protein QCA50_007366 [Cerrena zonata]|uniref:Fungal-type protein kinase domain-containing protein n=1 Tax=Cerrena zonata TaxID=2478898 RepID=A0AAW0GIK5_9APHY